MKIEKLINLDLLTQFFNNLKANFADKFSNSISIEYSELVTLRGESGLIPGMRYRITDFVTTTTEYDTMSAGHPFDVIVTAISENKLDEDAKAALHEGDTYFSNHKIETWKIKYCLDNNTNRFYWADDSENGKGVIYYMKDNLNNECGYDFKNILFKSPFRRSTNDENWYYTFTTTASEDPSEVEDDTLNERGHCYNNKIESCGSELNHIIFMRVCYDNRFDGNYCYSMMFGEYCSNNMFKTDCNYSSFGNRCYNNTFGNGCYNNTFGNSCYNNTFGNDCTDNTFGNSCNNNMFGYNCYNNIFSSDCNGNKFGSNCIDITLYDSCVNNKFENACRDINTVKNCVNNIFKTGCKYIKLINNDSYEHPVQKYIFDSGASGISNREYASYEVQRGLNYETKISNNSLDEVKEFCVADLIDAAGTQVELVDSTNIEYSDYDTMYLVCDRDYSQEYLTFEALEDNFTFIFKNNIEYKIEGDDTWNSLPMGTNSPALNAGQRILLKGNCKVSGRTGIGNFSSKQKFNAMGNVMSLLFGDDFKDKYDLTGYDYAFANLFGSTLILNAENLILPATALQPYCYYGMFLSCSSLTTAPELPATTLATRCYSNMFRGCSSLTTAPELPATELVSNCYDQMFSGCSNLIYIKSMFLTTPSTTYLNNWVYGVPSTGTFIKNAAATWTDTFGANGIPEGWNTIEYPCISPAIVNSNDDITFYYNDGLYTPKKRPISLLSIFDYSQMMQLKPECDIEVCILSEGSLVESLYEWKCNMSLNDVIDDLNLYYEDITIVINKVIIESDDAGYYGYYYY